MSLDAKNLNAYDFIKSFRGAMDDRLVERLESGDFFPLLEEDEGDGEEEVNENIRHDTMETDWVAMGTMEREVVVGLRALGKQLGSDEGIYSAGVMCLTFKNKVAVENFLSLLDGRPEVESYDLEVRRDNQMTGAIEEKEYDFDDVLLDGNFDFDVYIYINMDIVQQPAETLDVMANFDWDDEENHGFITEVKRRIRVNFKGKKTIKMQCSPGFKWSHAKRACLKISGEQKAVMRRASRKAVRTKKSEGHSLVVRMSRKSAKASRFRKGFGLAA